MPVNSPSGSEFAAPVPVAAWRPWAEGFVALALAWGGMHLGANPPGIGLDLLVVVLVAARYGYGPGMGLGLVAAGYQLLSAGQGPGVLLAVFTERSHLALAFAYVVVGAIVGLLGDVPRTQTQRLREALERVQGNFEQLEQRHGVLLAAKEAVDRRIVGQTQTMASLYDAARELESLVPQQIPPAMLRLLSRFLEVEAAAVYLFDGERLVLAAAHGEGTRAPALAPDHALYAVAVGGEPLSVTSEADHARSGVYLAHPLVAAGGRPRGLVAVERLPLRQLTPATRQMLALLADWGTRALANSEAYQQAEEQQRDHPVTRIHRLAHMHDRLAQEWSAARRYDLPLAAILVRDAALETAAGEDWNARAGAIAGVLKARLRNVDVLGHYRTRGSFLLLLPMTPLEGARILHARLVEALPGCLLAVGANQEGHADAEGLLQALQALVFPQELPRAG